MKVSEVVRAWKDPLFRASLTAGQRDALPGNPAGVADLTDEELRRASGLNSAVIPPGTTFPGCTESTLRRFRCCP